MNRIKIQCTTHHINTSSNTYFITHSIDTQPHATLASVIKAHTRCIATNMVLSTSNPDSARCIIHCSLFTHPTCNLDMEQINILLLRLPAKDWAACFSTDWWLRSQPEVNLIDSAPLSGQRQMLELKTIYKISKNRKSRWLLAFKETNQNTQEIKMNAI